MPITFRRLRALSFLLLLPLLLSCEKAVPDYFSYCSRSFSATLEGNIRGRDFSCEVSCRGGSLKELVFLTPESLCGLTVSGDKEGLVVSKDRLHAEFSPDQLSGLLLPARLLLLDGAGLRSVQKIPEGLLLSVSVSGVSSAVSLTLLPDGRPSVISCDEISFRISAWAEN